MIAYAFLQHRRLANAGRKKSINGPPPNRLCPPHATPSSISSFGRHIAESKFLKNSGENTFRQKSC